ncbi:PhnA domain-containing protein [Christiangramia sabulilitoris]|uniref:PhnA protein n=1 Tax=Christiangramia sabulilitoris TaxID=2583991 RepID=A0A550I059_9FLAO|nr:alkylphosphonate utilization protein [Christiangramia sabulilitoris]TRO64362.1 PhnA protein [Christiangramia sabulilitoris]
MTLEQSLKQRSDSSCELCGNKETLKVYEIPNSPEQVLLKEILICDICHTQLEDPEKTEPNHWRCLNDSMWSTVPAVQVMAWRMLNRLRSEGWPQDLLDMMYMEDEVKEWAKAGIQEKKAENVIVHKDSNGAIIEAGDTVVLTKDLNVKGSSLTAKRGAAVRRVSLVHDNAEQIEGKVEGQQIVILTKFVKKV